MTPRHDSGNPLEESVGELLAAPVGEFTARRREISVRLRAAGDSDAAKAVAAVRRPSLLVWALNRAAVGNPALAAEIAAASVTLLAAQRAVLAGEARAGAELSAAHLALREAIRRLAEQSVELIGAADRQGQLRAHEAALHAIAVGDSSLLSRLSRGRLLAIPDAGGFDPLAAMTAAPRPPTSTAVATVSQAVAEAPHPAVTAATPRRPAATTAAAKTGPVSGVELDRAVARVALLGAEEVRLGERHAAVAEQLRLARLDLARLRRRRRLSAGGGA